MNTFPIKKFKRIRRRTDYIILVPSLLLKEDFYIDGIVEDSGRLFTYGIWEKYWLKELAKDSLPCHYFSERIAEDFYVMKCLPDFQPSYFLEDLVQAGIINYKYRNSIMVVIGENFNRYPLDRRFCEQISSKVLDPLLREYGIHQDRILFIDEILNSNWKESFKESTLKYNLVTSKHFDMNILRQAINKYINYF